MSRVPATRKPPTGPKIRPGGLFPGLIERKFDGFPHLRILAASQPANRADHGSLVPLDDVVTILEPKDEVDPAVLLAQQEAAAAQAAAMAAMAPPPMQPPMDAGMAPPVDPNVAAGF